MNKEEVLRQIRDVGVVPVVRARSADEAARVVEAIKAGGVSVLEITMTVPRAVELIAELTERYVTGPYRLEVLEGVSHWIPEEVPARTAEIILARVSGAA